MILEIEWYQAGLFGMNLRKKFPDEYYVSYRTLSSWRQNSYLNFVTDCICLIQWPVEDIIEPNDNECQKLDIVTKPLEHQILVLIMGSQVTGCLLSPMPAEWKLSKDPVNTHCHL